MVNYVYRGRADERVHCTEGTLDDLEWTRIHE